MIYINNEHNNTAENTDIAMPMYNLIKNNDNYSDICRGLWHFKRNDILKEMNHL